MLATTCKAYLQAKNILCNKENQTMLSCFYRHMHPDTLRLWFNEHNLKAQKLLKKAFQTKNSRCSNKHGILHVCKECEVELFKPCTKYNINAVFQRATVTKQCKLVTQNQEELMVGLNSKAAVTD